MATDRGGVQAAVQPARPAGRWLSRWWLNRSVLVKGVLVLAIPLLALVAVAGAGLALQLRQNNERQDATAANTVAKASLTVLADAVDAETGIRGYAATADAVFLAPYTAALTRIEPDVRQLRAAATTDAERAQADQVAGTVNDLIFRLASLQAAVQFGATGPRLTPTLQAGRKVLDHLRAQIAALADGPAQLVVQKKAEIARLVTVIEVVEVTGLVLGIMAGVAGGALFTSGISRRVRLAADNANRLGQGSELLPTVAASDELGQLSQSLTQARVLLGKRLDQLSAARDQALLATQTKNTFLSRTSHELRTPLNAILGFAQLLEMNNLDPDDRDSTARILAAGRHLLALINELIDTARVESGELRLSMEPVSVDALTEQVATLMAPLAAARGITVEHDAAHHLAVFADQQRLLQVLVNLASNAVKYNHDGGNIRIGNRPDGPDQVQITVTDTGPGLTAEEIDRIFTPFERLQADQNGIEGTGIGLALSLGLTQAMHGALQVTSTPGAGSTFTVRLPRASYFDPYTGEPAANTDTTQSSPRGRSVDPTRPLVVLSIEDNTANSQVLARLLQGRPGTTLYAADTAAAGLSLVRQHRPDLILLDLHLPDLPGEEVFARLHADPATRNIPVVVLSADATPGTIRRLLARGATAYLTKPLDLRQLRDVLDTTAATVPQPGTPGTPRETGTRRR